MFIRVERTSKWDEHLETLRKMLNLFGPTGRINYAKSSRLYLQSMQNIQSNHQWPLDQCCKSSFHCLPRTNRFWVGLLPDLVIEQCIVWALKSKSGLTEGRLWPKVHEICESESYTSAPQDMLQCLKLQECWKWRKSWQTRDTFDLNDVTAQLRQYNLFDCQDPRFRCIFTGVAAADNDSINCHEAENVCMEIHKDLDKVVVLQAIIKRSNLVKNLARLCPRVNVNV